MRFGQDLQFEEIAVDLPYDFEMLRHDAAREGKRFVERLHAEWESGRQRFTGVHEALVAARVNGDLAGIGGLTVDPDMTSAMRMRRFYIRPSHRRHGIGRQLTMTLLSRSIANGTIVTVNTDDAGAALFWETLGFQFDPKAGHTHRLRWQGRKAVSLLQQQTADRLDDA
ncbi:GNAT family N-acetyltransferase [Rhizobium sp. A37_96]